jgi:hypothetical protein
VNPAQVSMAAYLVFFYLFVLGFLISLHSFQIFISSLNSYLL